MRALVSIILFLLLLLTDSCSKNNVAPPCLLTKKTSITLSGSITDTFEYDSHYKLISMTEVSVPTASPNSLTTTTYTYTYVNGKVSSVFGVVAINGLTNKSLSNWTNENGRVIRITTDTNISTGTTIFAYDSQGKLTNWDYTDTDLNTNNISYTATYDASGNLKSDRYKIIYQTLIPAVETTTNYSGFDAGNNPYALVAQAIGQPFFYGGVVGYISADFISKNNRGSAQQPTVTYTYAHEYNSRNYITKTVVHNSNSADTVTILYEYANCN